MTRVAIVPRELSAVRRRHELRCTTLRFPDLKEQPLADAWRALQLHWLRTVPGYRDELRTRVAHVARETERKARVIEGLQRRNDPERYGE